MSRRLRGRIPNGAGGEESAASKEKAGSSGATKRKKSRKAEPDVTSATSDAIKARLFELRQRGFNRLFQRGQIYEFSTPESLLEINFGEPLFALVDRIAVSAESRARIVDAAEISFRESGEVTFETAAREGSPSQQLRFSQRFECKTCGIRYAEPEPRLFSFNSKHGWCETCFGTGEGADVPALRLRRSDRALDQAETSDDRHRDEALRPAGGNSA